MYPTQTKGSKFSQLDKNKFRTLSPINALFEEHFQHLIKHTRVQRLNQGDLVFAAGDADSDSIFLLSGAITQGDATGRLTQIAAGSEQSSSALDSLNTKEFPARVSSDNAVIARVDNRLLRKLSTTEHSASPWAVSESSVDVETLADGEWTMCLLRSQAFQRLPHANVQAFFEHLEEVRFESGETIVRAGESGDYFYLIKEGRLRVSRESDCGTVTLAQLTRYDSFGEEALISDSARNATVTALSQSKLMRLPKDKFQQLLGEPLLKKITVKQADDLIRKGALLIDVREESDYSRSGLTGSINIPLYLLRLKMRRLQPRRPYILYCDTGALSSTATFILNHQGFNASTLAVDQGPTAGKGRG